LNYIETRQRSGVYKVPLPGSIGMEACGVVEEIGEGVTVVEPGDRVAYAMGDPGAYTESRIMPANRLIPVPDWIPDDQAAAMMLKGMTAAYLVTRTFKVEKGQTVLFHAAAGGVGLIICQMLKEIGATVIGTVGSDEKAELANSYGCDYPIVYTREDFAARVREITDGAGVPVVYDAVGAATFEGSFNSLAPFGLFASFGAASGAIPPIEIGLLQQKGSLYATRPTLATHTAKRQDMLDLANSLFEAVRRGVQIPINQRFELKDAAEAHRALEGRQTTGCSVFTV
jgi:NADPH2:quinone reductase